MIPFRREGFSSMTVPTRVPKLARRQELLPDAKLIEPAEIETAFNHGLQQDKPEGRVIQWWGYPNVSIVGNKWRAAVANGGVYGVLPIVVGDYDIQIEFSGAIFPSYVYVMSLGISNNDARLVDWSAGRLYSLCISGSNYGNTYSSDTSGGLRHIRSGTSWSAYRLSGGSWVWLSTQTNATFAQMQSFYFCIWNNKTSPTQQADWFNLKINKGVFMHHPAGTNA